MKNLFVLCCILSLTQCGVPSDKLDVEEFILKDGVQIELVASEPLLKSPVAIDFDLKGRIWAVELTGYMRDLDGSEEELADGNIVMLKDNDLDGQMDERVVFLDGLVLPRAVKCYNNGILYAEPPNLWWVEVNEDDTPGERVLVDSMYTNGGNVEHMPNGLLYNIDNWIYNAKSDRRYRYKNGEWEVSPTIYRGQWGITNDAVGRLFYNDNSNPLFGDHVLPNSMDKNIYLERKHLYRQNIAGDRKFYPYQATAVNRGYMDDVLMPDGKVKYFTSACSPLIYKGTSMGSSYTHNAFVCGPEANLIKRYEMSISNDGGVMAAMTDTVSEFIVSMDETFRPVNLNDGPDGSMYIVDMRKGIIQHRAYLTTYLIDLIKKRGLDQYSDGGRIYRVSKSGYMYKYQDYSLLTENEWIKLLGSGQYWTRIKAQEWLVLHGDQGTAAKLREGYKDKSDQWKIHALWALEGLDGLDDRVITDIILTSDDPNLASTCIQLLSRIELTIPDSEWIEIVNHLNRITSPDVALNLAFLAGSTSNEPLGKMWASYAGHSSNRLMHEALMSGLKSGSKYYQRLSTPNPQLEELALSTLENEKNNKTYSPKLNMSDVTDPRTKGLFLYHQYCATCHGRDGKGVEGIAPHLYESPFLNGPSEQLVLITLQGMTGPLVMDGEEYHYNAAMPGIKNNPELTDEKIRDILLWIRNSFSSSHESFSTEMVAQLRKYVDGRDQLFTQEELEGLDFEMLIE